MQEKTATGNQLVDNMLYLLVIFWTTMLWVFDPKRTADFGRNQCDLIIAQQNTILNRRGWRDLKNGHEDLFRSDPVATSATDPAVWDLAARAKGPRWCRVLGLVNPVLDLEGTYEPRQPLAIDQIREGYLIENVVDAHVD